MFFFSLTSLSSLVPAQGQKTLMRLGLHTANRAFLFPPLSSLTFGISVSLFRPKTRPILRRLINQFSLRSYSLSPPAMDETRAPKAPDQLVQHEGKEYRVVKEGLAYILNRPTEEAASKGTKKDLKEDEESQSVFYNPIQQFNRDLSVLAIKAFGEHVLALRKQKAAEKRKNRKGPEQGTKRKRDEELEGKQGNEDEPGGSAQIANQQSSASQKETEHSPSFTILDALSATGLRALRYASELPFASRIVANDLSPSAIQSMKTNITYNGLEQRIQPNIGDARMYMYNLLDQSAAAKAKGSHGGKFDVIDLDPYGTAAPFMDAAVQGVKDGGLLCVTCTDAGVWASHGYPEKSFALYGGVPIKGSHSHEGGLRLILQSLATSAAKYGLAIEPLLSLSIDFYARVFLRIHRSPAEVKYISGNSMIVFNCDAGCGAWSTQHLTQTKQKLDKKGKPFHCFGIIQGPTAGPRCGHCGSKTHLAGPMWAGPLHNNHFIRKILNLLPQADRDIYQTVDRIEGMLTTALEEDLTLDNPSCPTPEHVKAASDDDLAIIPRLDPAAHEPHPFYFSLGALSKVLHTKTVSVDALRGALAHLGYRSALSHTKPNTIRTNAPWEVVWEVMREWVRQKAPIKEGVLKPGSPGATIMSQGREAFSTGESSAYTFDLLKKEIISAAESGKDVNDVVTKVEAALYRTRPLQASIQAGPHKDPQDGDEPDLNKSETSLKHNDVNTLDVVFDEALGKNLSSRKRLMRYQINPRANWGPLNRASGGR